MSERTIREVTGEERLKIIKMLPGYSFRSSPPLVDKEAWKDILDERVGTIYYALFEGDQPLACVARAPMQQSLRGKILPMGGVFDVVTQPAARRKGYARRLMATIFSSMHAEGRPLTSLYPFRESFYENLGYVSFSQPHWARIVPANLGNVMKMNLEGEIELRLLSESFDAYHAFLKRYQQHQPGMGLFENRPESPGMRRDFWVAFARIDSEVRGVMLYNLRGEREMEFDLRALRFYYLDSRARYLLLDWIARHVDQARSVELLLAPAEQPEKWVVDSQIKVTGELFTGMGRILSISALEGIQAGSGRFIVNILDPHCPWNEGAWCFEGTDEGLRVRRATEASCTLRIQALSALVYGTHDPQDFVFRGWGDPPQDLQTVMRVMFPAQQPYLHEFF